MKDCCKQAVAAEREKWAKWHEEEALIARAKAEGAQAVPAFSLADKYEGQRIAHEFSAARLREQTE